MVTQLLIISDTHLRQGGSDLPAALWAAVEAADVVVHAGDWVDASVLDRMEGRSRLLVGVHGNNDVDAVRARLPEVALADVDGVRLVVIHETGPSQGRDRRCSDLFLDVDVLVFGHSHIPWDTTTESGLRLLNPGSPTLRRRQPHCTYMTARAHAGTLSDVELHRLPTR